MVVLKTLPHLITMSWEVFLLLLILTVRYLTSKWCCAIQDQAKFLGIADEW